MPCLPLDHLRSMVQRSMQGARWMSGVGLCLYKFRPRVQLQHATCSASCLRCSHVMEHYNFGLRAALSRSPVLQLSRAFAINSSKILESLNPKSDLWVVVALLLTAETQAKLRQSSHIHAKRLRKPSSAVVLKRLLLQSFSTRTSDLCGPATLDLRG